MNWGESIRRLWGAVRKRRQDRDMEEELRLHFEMAAEDLERRGISAGEAKRAARVQFGGIPSALEAMRDQRGLPWLEDLLCDARQAGRLLRRSPAFSAVAILTLALGIGANAATFSIIKGVLLRPLPFHDTGSLAMIWSQTEHDSRLSLRPPHLAPLQSITSSFDFIAVQFTSRVSKQGEPPVSVSTVSPDFLKVFRIQPAIGRDFTAEDAQPGAPPVTLISHEFWQSRFASDPNVVGRTLIIPDAVPLTIIGVLPDGMRNTGLGKVESVWVLTNLDPSSYMGYGFKTFGRLKPGVTVHQAELEMAPRWNQVYPPPVYAPQLHPAPFVELMIDYIVGDYRPTLLVFGGAVFSVLLIVIVTLTGLQLARLPLFERELALRSALGASRWRLIRLMIIQTLILGVSGGLVGLLIASASHSVLLSKMPYTPRKTEISFDATVWAVGLSLAILSSLAIAIVPALRATRSNLREMIHTAAPTYTADRKARLFQDFLTASQTAIALVLVLTAGLFIHNLSEILSPNLGFDRRGVASLRVTLPATYNKQQQAAYFDDLLERVRAMPGVEVAAEAFDAPLEGGTYSHVIPLDGSSSNPKASVDLNLNGVTAGYFSTLRLPIVIGRTFTEFEIQTNAPVVVVSTSLAAKTWPAKPPVGRHLQLGDRILEVVGVVGDAEYAYYDRMRSAASGARHLGMASIVTERYTAYLPLPQQMNRMGSVHDRSAVLLARTGASPKALTAIASGMEPKVEVESSIIDDSVSLMTADQHFQTSVLASFGLIALLLACLGNYGVVAQSVIQKTREIGIRMALGARATEVFGHICRRHCVPGVIGILLGFPASVAMKRLIASYLFAVRPDDALTYFATAVVMCIAIAVACVVPARRAMKMDPVAALRCD